MDVKKDIVIRLVLIYIAALLLAVVIIGQILYLQVSGNEKYKSLAAEVELKPLKTTPERGNICASDGKVLATSLPFYEIRLDFVAMKNIDSLQYKLGYLADSLSGFFRDKTKNEYRTEFLNELDSGNRFYLLKQEITYDEYQKIRTFPVFNKGRYKGGFIAIQKSKRILPYRNLAARTIGSLQNNKYIGIEGYFNSELTGDVTERLYKKVGPNWIPQDEDYFIFPSSGKDVITTIDVNYQDFAHNALLEQMLKLNADTGVVILMEVKTGEIKAMVNLTRVGEGKYIENNNYAVGMLYEPGSTFKLASFITAMEDGYIDLRDSINTGNGTLGFKDFTIREAGNYGYGRLTVQEVFEKSSNVGTAKLIFDHYNKQRQRFVNRLHSLGLSEKTGIEIPGEPNPKFKNPDNKKEWSGVSLPQIAIGYEIMLTPLQVLNFYNSVANNGVMVRPRIIKALRERGKIIREYHTDIISSSICSKATLERAKIILKGVVKRGTATNIDGAPYIIAGKTGTAQVADKNGYKNGNYRENAHFGSFAGYFPANSPEYSCIVVIKTHDPHYFYGNLVAAPVFKIIADKVYATSLSMQKERPSDTLELYRRKVPNSKIGDFDDLDFVFNELRVPVRGNNPGSKWVLTKETATYIEYQNRTISNGRVPLVIGMGLKDAVYLLESAGLRVIFNGKGTVTGQSIEAGSQVQKNQAITITLG